MATVKTVNFYKIGMRLFLRHKISYNFFKILIFESLFKKGALS